jgi:TRAP-type mannitol/chloroaromatic compound transport system substrate-binding protein
MRRARKASVARRRFLAAASGAAALAVPAVARAQAPVTLRMQSTWPAQDILHEYAVDFARRVNETASGELHIEVLPVGAVSSAFGLLDAVSKGLVDAGHGSLGHHYRRHAAFALWGTGPAFGMEANVLLAWHKYGGGKELLARLYAALGADVTSFLYGPMPTQPLGWFKKAIRSPDDFKGLRFRTEGLPIELFAALGAVVNALPADAVASAIERGVIDGAEVGNATSDRNLGLPGVAPVYMLQSYHRNAEQLEILFNKARFDALAPRLRALLESAAEAASADMSWKAIDRYSSDYRQLLSRYPVRAYRTADSVLQRQLDAHDAAAKKRRPDPLFREIEDSQRRFAERAVRWLLDTQVSAQLAYRHYFGARPAAKAPQTKK